MEDIPALQGMYGQLFAEMAALQPGYWRAVEPEDGFLVAAIKSADWDIFIEEADGTIAGFVVLKEGETPPYPCFRQHRFACLMDMFVSAEHRGRGIGTGLLECARTWAAERGLDYVELQVLENNEGASRLYGRNGFSCTQRTMRLEIGD